MSKKLNLKDIGGYRRVRNQNQITFWGRFGVTQSAGSRYETGRDMPVQVAALIWLVDSGKLDETDLQKALAVAKKQLG